MKVLYTAEVTSEGGRENGHVRSSDGVLDIDVGLPKEFGGGGDKTNPEQLFAAGYAACFENAVIHTARRKKIEVKDTAVTARVGMGPGEGGIFGLEVELQVSLPGLERAQAEELVEDAHKVCPYSNATRGNVEVTLTVVEPQPVG
ncbi:MAG: organic hydroperoxide resistance protein [Dehalococcoidia bacterium]